MFGKLQTHVNWSWILPAALGLFLGVGPVAAGDHDLRMESITIGDGENHLKAGCGNWLSASFSVHGVDDYRVDSGEIEISFYYRAGGDSEWRLIETLPVTFVSPLVARSTWPQASGSEPSAIRFVAPSQPTVVDLRAVVAYLAVEDDASWNNEIVRRVANLEDDDCGLVANICVHCLKQWVCGPILPREPLYAGFKRQWVDAVADDGSLIQVKPGLCGLVDCPPCVAGLSCRDEPFVLDFRQPAELRIALYGNGVRVAEAKRLRRPLELEGQAFHYRLEFEARQGVSYRLAVEPVAQARLTGREPLSIDVRLRRAARAE